MVNKVLVHNDTGKSLHVCSISDKQSSNGVEYYTMAVIDNDGVLSDINEYVSGPGWGPDDYHKYSLSLCDSHSYLSESSNNTVSASRKSSETSVLKNRYIDILDQSEIDRFVDSENFKIELRARVIKGRTFMPSGLGAVLVEGERYPGASNCDPWYYEPDGFDWSVQELEDQFGYFKKEEVYTFGVSSVRVESK